MSINGLDDRFELWIPIEDRSGEMEHCCTGRLTYCVRHAISRGYHYKEVDIISCETGEVLDIEWKLEIRVYETIRRVADTVSDV